MSSAITYVEIFSNIVFGGSLLVNTFFIYIVYSKTKKGIGSYKYLMIWFAVINILYSFAEFISKPTIFVFGYSYIAYSKGYLTDYQNTGFYLLCFFMTMYGMNTAVLSLQFIYRYLFVCRHTFTFLIEEKRYIFMWIMAVLAWGATYGFITYYCFHPTAEYYKYARNFIMSELALSVEDMTFYSVFVYILKETYMILYWTLDENHRTVSRFCYVPLGGPKLAKESITSGLADKAKVTSGMGPVVLKA
ncbi:unnamed protein product [Heligmosomoides polygyrus]|uniref:Serpentine receptor class gamma n=1 Tax=Heligmosomoides polygyrus TaxID=6339 RepID=A0A183FV53_HELPZ|nr:unnamed protein product [Heligmosomoides polygyrus]